MKEISFLKQNAGKWEAYEKAMEDRAALHPSQMTTIFLELTDDYAYSKTNYPGSNTTSYLNQLLAKSHQLIYKNKKESNRRVLMFWTTELPRLFGTYQKLLLVSFVISVIGTALGFVSQLSDDSFVRLILGDNYVNETIDRIKRGNPLGIYGEMPQWYDFVYITANNIRVSFLALAMGMIFSFGTGF
ncbi:MAG: stage II sporulation protein M, partial [Bacteroidia bacterium]